MDKVNNLVWNFGYWSFMPAGRQGKLFGNWCLEFGIFTYGLFLYLLQYIF